MSQEPEIGASSPVVAEVGQGLGVVESRGVETLTDQPSDAVATDPSAAGSTSSQAPRQDAPLPAFLDDQELADVEAESARDPSCPWSRIKLAMAAEIRFLRGAVDARLPTLAAEVADLRESRFNFRAHLERQAAWSERTFGPGHRTRGVVDHIRKELHEVLLAHDELEPTLPEWIDVVILALDGAWRSGAAPEGIIEALIAKQAKNEARTWPDWRTADPNKAIEHDRSATA